MNEQRAQGVYVSSDRPWVRRMRRAESTLRTFYIERVNEGGAVTRIELTHEEAGAVVASLQEEVKVYDRIAR